MMLKAAGRRALVLSVLLVVGAEICAGQSYRKNPSAFIRHYLGETPSCAMAGDPAVVLYEKSGSVLFNTHRATRNEHSVERVIKILNRDGLALANVSIPVRSTAGRFPDLHKVRATVYTLDKGVVVKDELKSATTFHDELAPGIRRLKFSIPNVRVGSIIVYSYGLDEPLDVHVESWPFQERIPKLWSEAEIVAPKELTVAGFSEHLPPFARLESVPNTADSLLPPALTVTGNSYAYDYETAEQRWIWRDIPAVPEQPFLMGPLRHSGRLDIRITGYTALPESMGFMNTWKKADESLVASFGFYQHLLHRQDATRKQARLTAGEGSLREKALRIYNYVRDNAVSPEETYSFMADKNPEEVLKTGAGSRSEKNFLLIAMLRFAGIDAEPVLVSTRSHIAPVETFPLLYRFNLTICELRLDGKPLYLDASVPLLPFGAPGPDSYSGYARVITDTGGRAVYLNPIDYGTRSVLLVKTVKADKDDYRIQVTQLFSADAARAKRAQWMGDTAAIRRYAKDFAGTSPLPAILLSWEIQNLANTDTNLVLVSEMAVEWPAAGEMMPLCLFPLFRENPFKAATRKLPVELDGRTDEMYMMTLQLPEGITASEVPAAEQVVFDERSGFSFQPAYDPAKNTVQVMARLRLNDVSFPAEDYAALRTFYERMLALQQKVILLK